MPINTEKKALFSLSTQNVQQYARIAIYNAAAMFGYDAFIKGSTGQMIVGGIITALTLLWTLYGSRAAVKINDLVGTGVIEAVVTNDTAVANEVDSNRVVSVAQIQDNHTDTSVVEAVIKQP